MFHSPPPPSQDPDAQTDLDEDRIWELGLLKELAEIGMRLARNVGQEPAEAATPEEAQSRAQAQVLPFTRAAKMVRQTLALRRRMAAENFAADLKRGEDRAARAAAAAQRHEKAVEVRSEIHDGMMRAIHESPTRPPAEIERLLDDLDDWIERQDEEVFHARPIGATVLRACLDLGLPMDLGFWRWEGWGDEENCSRPPGSPFTAWRRTRTPPQGLIWSDPDNEPP
jgi:hypothetical protein